MQNPALERPKLVSALTLAAALAVVMALPASAQEPKRKDSRLAMPREVKFTTAVEPAEAKPGETVTLKVTAALDPKWHLYSVTMPDGGPKKTEFDLFDPAGLEPVGDWEPSEEPKKEKEDVFPDLEFVEYHEGEITWSHELKVPADATPGAKEIRLQVGFQICNDTLCKPPGRWTLPPVEVKVLPGGGGATSAIDEAIGGGLLSFLAFCAVGGLFALAMPCVWPMVPITVNFFVKQGQGKSHSGRTFGLALTYCLAIIGVFTLVGVVFSAVFGAASLQRLANNAWLNLMVAALFVAFGLSLLGVFELRLPSFLLNASAQGESRGGVVGVIFMALTLTITSFTCTFPVVGALLVKAAGGNYLYPIIGLMTFATVLALPFFLLALAPGLIQKMPRGGDWMNAVKVVGGLVEIGAAFKFLNTAEIALGATPDEAWFDAQAVLAIWVVLAAICGIYLLGLFRTDHDHGEIRVGPGRMLTGTLFLIAALYLAPALFGVPPKSRFFNTLVVGLLPPDSYELEAVAAAPAAGAGAGAGRVAASSNEPAEAIREEREFHGVSWGLSYDQALERARAEGRPVLIDFTGVNCATCRQMERDVIPRPEVVERLEQFVTIRLYTDFVPIKTLSQDQRETLGEDNQVLQVELVNENTTPLYVVLNGNGEVLASVPYTPRPADFVAFLDRALARFSGDQKIARAE